MIDRVTKEDFMNTCATCRHWKPYTEEGTNKAPDHLCERLKQFTAADFGCTLWAEAHYKQLNAASDSLQSHAESLSRTEYEECVMIGGRIFVRSLDEPWECFLPSAQYELRRSQIRMGGCNSDRKPSQPGPPGSSQASPEKPSSPESRPGTDMPKNL